MNSHFWEEIQRLNNLDTRFNPSERKVVKMTEELGELAEAVLINSNHKLQDQEESIDPQAARAHVLEEAVDMLIMTASLMRGENFTLDEVNAMCRIKLAKWERKIRQRQESLADKYKKD